MYFQASLLILLVAVATWRSKPHIVYAEWFPLSLNANYLICLTYSKHFHWWNKEKTKL